MGQRIQKLVSDHNGAYPLTSPITGTPKGRSHHVHEPVNVTSPYSQSAQESIPFTDMQKTTKSKLQQNTLTHMRNTLRASGTGD